MQEVVYEYHPYGDTTAAEKLIYFYCDECGDEAQLYDFDGQELCLDCIEQKLDKIN